MTKNISFEFFIKFITGLNLINSWLTVVLMNFNVEKRGKNIYLLLSCQFFCKYILVILPVKMHSTCIFTYTRSQIFIA